MKRLMPAILISILFFAACSKGGVANDDEPHIINNNDTIPPVLEIHTPITDEHFNNGNTISITGKITDEGGLYRGSIRLVDDATAVLIKEQLIEIHGFQLYNFNVSHTASVTATTNYTVTVKFEDHGLNTVSKSVKIKVNP
jgi:hypothetical protein